LKKTGCWAKDPGINNFHIYASLLQAIFAPGANKTDPNPGANNAEIIYARVLKAAQHHAKESAVTRDLFFIFYVACLAVFFTGTAEARTYAYIPGFGDGDVTRIDTDDESLTPVAFGDDPYGAAVTPAGDYLVVTRPSVDSVTLVSTNSFSSTDAQVLRDVGDDPRGVAIETQGNYAYVANYGADTVSKIYIPSFTVTDTIGVGDGPWGIAAYYDEVDSTPKVYVSNNLEGSISVITDDDVRTISDVSGGPLGLALTPDGAYLYVALYDDDQVAIYQTSDRTLVKTIAVGDGPWGVAMGSDGAYVYVTNSLDDTVTVIDADSQTFLETYDVGDQPMGVACPKNGDFAYVINQTDDTVSKIDIVDQSVTLIDSLGISGAFGLGAFIGGAPPAAPSDLGAVLNGDNRIDLTWTDNSSDELGFKIERRRDTEDQYVQISTAGADDTTYTDGGLGDNTTYSYRVRAYSEAADSGYSDAASATTGAGEFSWCFIQTLTR
jgi:YVTN family beta-propeller protein